VTLVDGQVSVDQILSVKVGHPGGDVGADHVAKRLVHAVLVAAQELHQRAVVAVLLDDYHFPPPLTTWVVVSAEADCSTR